MGRRTETIDTFKRSEFRDYPPPIDFKIDFKLALAFAPFCAGPTSRKPTSERDKLSARQSSVPAF